MEESRNLPEGELTEQEEQQKLSEVLQIRRDKLESLKAEGKNPFEITTYSRTAYARQIVDRFDELEGREVSIAGRMMSRRIMGKASFLDLRDASGRVQSYVRRDEVGDERYADFKKWDIGDIVGIRGEVFRTQKGEISVKAHEIVLLSKSLLPLPEKWHGLKDTELRYRLENELLNLWKQSGTTVIFITHNIEEAVYLGERILVLSNKPTSIKRELENPLPMPRDIAAPEFIALRQQVTDLIKWW